MRIYKLLGIILLLLPLCAFSAVYKWKDSQGVVNYSDRPNPNSQSVDLPPSTVSKNPNAAKKPTVNKTTSLQAPSKLKQPVKKTYDTFSFKNLKNEQTFHNQREIPVALSLKPELQPGDKIQLLLDGKIQGEPEASSVLMLNNVDRGKHTLQAQVINKAGEVIKSTDTITLYIHYAALGVRPILRILPIKS